MIPKKILLFAVFSCIAVRAPCLSPNLSAESAILMNADTGAILYEKNSRDLHYPASTTKIATCAFALKTLRHDLDRKVIIQKEAVVSITTEAKKKANYTTPAYWNEPNGCHIGLKGGEEIALRDLFLGMMLGSANDAANSVALLFGTIPEFMDKLNAYLKSIGCERTHYLNPHGIHHPQHQTCAYDLAIMTREALKDPLFREFVATVRCMRPKTNLQKSYPIVQGNRLLRQGKHYYEKAIGVKTGFHSHAKHAFVGAARSGDRTLIVVFMKCPDRTKMFDEAKQLFEMAFNQPKVEQTFIPAEQVAFTRHFVYADGLVKGHLDRDIHYCFYPAEDPKPNCLLYWDKPTFPIIEGQKLGEVHLVVDDKKNGSDKVITKANIIAANSVYVRWPYSWVANVRSFVVAYPFLASIILIITLGIVIAATVKLVFSRRG